MRTPALFLAAPFLLLLQLATAHLAQAREKTPEWIAAAIAAPVTVATGKANAVTLLDEARIDIKSDGVITNRTRFVLRILTRDGIRRAVATTAYNTDGMTVRSFKAWVISPKGETTLMGKDDFLDFAVSGPLELYGESRQQSIHAVRHVETASVFAYESIIEEKTILNQQPWTFQSDIPVERSSITVNLPPGWQVSARTYNHEPVVPVVSATSTTWTLKQLPALESEPLGPPISSLAAQLAIDFVPPPATHAAARSIPCTSWTALSEYFTPLYEAAGAPDAAIKAKADALVSAHTSSWERIGALCLHAQRINYISINLNASRGGGMVPRPPATVFRCNYGDCKDKANLLRVLLKTQGITAYPLIVYSGDFDGIREDWVSPAQFNHCILAISVDETVNAPAVLTHPTLGRLLLFDPTDEYTPPGWLPPEDAGGRGLLLAGKQGELIALPDISMENNRSTARIVAKLSPTGQLTGSFAATFTGLSSSALRQAHATTKASEFAGGLQRYLAETMHAPKILRSATKDHFEAATLDLSFDFDAAHYGKMMRNELLIVKPVLVSRRDNNVLKKGKRTQPVLIRATAFSESNEIELPEGFRVEETPEPLELKAPFGSYTARAEVREKRLYFERTLELRAFALPATDYEVARVFFEKILQAEQSPIVLKRL